MSIIEYFNYSHPQSHADDHKEMQSSATPSPFCLKMVVNDTSLRRKLTSDPCWQAIIRRAGFKHCQSFY
jgi:hypothetical protein